MTQQKKNADKTPDAAQSQLGDWSDLLEELERRRTQARAMGGEKKLNKLRAAKRLNARELIDTFCDADSFQEIGTLTGGFSYDDRPPTAADALVCGIGRVDGRGVLVSAEDFTVMGGSIGMGTNAKKMRLCEMATALRLPMVNFLDGAGERMQNQLERRPRAGNDMQLLARLSGQVPTIGVVVGISAGHGAVTGMLCDLLVMTRSASIFAAGPGLVAQATGKLVDKDALGPAAMHAEISGVAHQLVEDELEAIKLIRRYLAYLPANAWQLPPRQAASSERTAARRLDELLRIVPRQNYTPYDMREVITCLVDRPDDWLELQDRYGESMITGFGRLGGCAIGIVANQPAHMAGAITCTGADKAAHFLDICDAYHLPVVFLADNPGVISGTQAEREGILRSAARMYAAQVRLSSLKMHATLRKAYGFGSSLMAMNPGDEQGISVAFPGITLGAMPSDSGGKAAGLDEASQKTIERMAESSAWTAGDTLAYDEIIDPRELRNVFLRTLQNYNWPSNPQPSRHAGVRP